MFSASFGPPTFRCERLFLLLRISGSSAENFISLFVSLCDCLSMELFIRRRWRLINKLLYFVNCAYVCGRHFINATACPLSQYKPSYPSTTELHGMYVSHSIDLLVSLSVSFSLCLSVFLSLSFLFLVRAKNPKLFFFNYFFLQKQVKPLLEERKYSQGWV